MYLFVKELLINIKYICKSYIYLFIFIKVLKWMREYEEIDYARSGFITQETITLPEGPIPDFSHSIEPHLRQLGMPTALQKGVVTLIKEYTVCKIGQALTPEQARILVNMLFNIS